jgi:hypothetical protein
MKKLVMSVTVLAAICFIFAGAARADQIFSTPGGSTSTTGSPVSATVDFSLSGSTLTITLTDTQAGITNAGQLLTDVFFTLSAGSPALSSQTGDLIMIDSGGAITDMGASTLGWGFGPAIVNSTDGFELCVICQGGPTSGATPSEGIIGPTPNGNGSIDGNKPHNPFINQTATFTLTGVSAGASVGDVLFSFGTVPGDNVPAGPPTSAPEPSSLLLLAVGLMGVVALTGRKLIAA